jgi:hypothetical protein
LSLLSLALITSVAFAATTHRVATPTISTTPAVSDTAVDSVVDDLQGVVVLCATQPKSQAFTDAWTSWLREHPDADVEVTINEVVRRANSTSSMTRGLAAPGSYHVPDRRISEHMRVTARSVRLRR